MPDDDRYVRNALRDTNRYDGDVVVKNVSIEDLSTYGPLVNDLHVNQSPAVVVIDGNLKGHVLTGYADRISINQVIADAHDASVEPDIKDAYLRKFNDTCGRLQPPRRALVAGRRSAATRRRVASLDRALAIVGSYRHVIARTAAPAKWRGMRAGWIKMMDQTERVPAGPEEGGQVGQRGRSRRRDRSLLEAQRDRRSLDRRFNAAGVTGCADQPPGPRLMRSWTRSASKSISPRPPGAASCCLFHDGAAGGALCAADLIRVSVEVDGRARGRGRLRCRRAAAR